MIFPALKKQNPNRVVPDIKGCFLEEQFVSSPWKVLQHTRVWGGPSVSAGGWAKLQVRSPRFSQLVFAGCVCLTAQGAVRTWKDSRFVSSPLVCSSTVWESGRVWEVSALCFSWEEGTKKHSQHPTGVEAAQNEVQSSKMRCRPVKGSWEICWALNQYPCSLIYRTGHMRDLIDGVMELSLIYLTTEGNFISY